MRNFIITLLALALTSFAAKARPVDQETAKRLGQSFVTSRFEQTRQSSDLNLVHTAYSERGEACFYIFNVGNTGFVIMAADDHYRPIIGYSDERVFNVNDMAPALVDYLDLVRQGVMAAAQTPSAPAWVAADWAMLENCGRLVSRHGGREDEYLVQTTWNQNYPYNYFCPVGDGTGPGGHCYAGCVATAAAQLMKYWNHPLQGQGSHTYIPEDHPEYGPLTVDFGAATYDWDNMPNSISADAPLEQIEAVALLIYHAGVSVDMNYRPTSSGAYTTVLCESMPQHFHYTEMMSNLSREDYTHEDYMQLIIDAIDMNWPMVHRGGGHAYVLDGYDDNDMVHFNWGWSGSNDGFFNVDDHDYAEGESVIYNYVPAEIYANTPNMPTNLAVVASGNNSMSATISWVNPLLTMNDQPLDAIDQIYVERNGQIVYVEDNVTPGAEMSIVDESVPYVDAFDYAVYAVTGGRHGAMARVKNAFIGPTCTWRIIGQSSNFQGWNGGRVSLYTSTGKEIQSFAITSSATTSVNIPVPVGRGCFGWTAPIDNVSNMALVIKDSENHSVFTYQGNSSGLSEGTILEFNNGCGNENPMVAPYGLGAETEEDNVILTWEADNDPVYGFIVYRDGHLFGMTSDGASRSFTDQGIDAGHCYTVTALDAGGESPSSNETCASAGDCMGATNFDFEYTGQYYRIKLKWNRPDSDGLTGYYLFRRKGEEGDYARVKILGASATSYTDNTANEDGVYYYYRLYAYYRDIDCTSAPATVKDNPNQFFLSVYYSSDDVMEKETATVNVFPNPADQSFRVEAGGMTQVMFYDMLGQQVFESACDGDGLNVNVSSWSEGIYLMKVQTAAGVLSRRVSIVHSM